MRSFLLIKVPLKFIFSVFLGAVSDLGGLNWLSETNAIFCRLWSVCPTSAGQGLWGDLATEVLPADFNSARVG
jgi:hypothetical protein